MDGRHSGVYDLSVLFFNFELGMMVEVKCSPFPIILPCIEIGIIFNIEGGNEFGIGVGYGLRHCARFSSDRDRE